MYRKVSLYTPTDDKHDLKKGLTFSIINDHYPSHFFDKKKWYNYNWYVSLTNKKRECLSQGTKTSLLTTNFISLFKKTLTKYSMIYNAKTFQWSMLLLLVICFQACKKDAISVRTEKAYYERVINPPGGWGGDGMGLRLKPNGSAILIEGGDMASEGRYRISGNKLTLRTTSRSEPYKFTIISEQEIHAETGEVLIFDRN
ncbi:MAG: hypothetical protein WKF66_20870 [Pedobacter sp.]